MKFLLLLLLACTHVQASEDFIEDMCEKYKAKDCEAVKAVAWVESNFRHVVNEFDGGSPSYGPMQIKCIAAKTVGLKFGCEQLRNNRKVAMRFGIKFLELKMKKCKKMEEAFAAYNADRVIRCRTYRPSKCYPNEFVNHKYVYKVNRRYKYERYKKFKDVKNEKILVVDNNK